MGLKWFCMVDMDVLLLLFLVVGKHACGVLDLDCGGLRRWH